METMRYSETRKTSKGPVIGFFAFVILGCAFIAFGMYVEEGNGIFGKRNVVDGLVNIYDDVDIYGNTPSVPTVSGFDGIEYKVSDKTYLDKSNKKIKSNIVIPVISINGEELTKINEEINKEYTDRFASFKETLASAENNFTYKVTYNTYENIVGDKKIVSITIWQRTIDDAAGTNVFDKIDTYNIDVSSKEDSSTEVIAKAVLGDEYKLKVKSAVKTYVTSKCEVDSSTFIYAMSGLEKCYIKDGKFHIIINSGELVDKKYGVLDIIIE